jgi:hypothetical protein
MKFFQSFKEKRLRLRLEEYRKNTAAGEWITPLNPDNIQIEFLDLGNHEKSMLYGKKIILNEKYESEELFTSLIYELWHLKQKREMPFRFWLYTLFCPWQIYIPAREKKSIAYNWLTEKGYNE